MALYSPAAATTGLRERRTKSEDATIIWAADLHIHEKIKVLIDGGIIETTPGRVLFNTIVPKELGFQNYVLRKKTALELVLECYKKIGLEATVQFLDNMKNLGFAEATKAALSMGTCDVKVPAQQSASSRRSL